MKFTTNYAEILERLGQIDPIKYGASRNYIDGAVSYLSPYISRGVISTKQVLEVLKSRNFDLPSIEKFIQELAWRDYWQQVWIAKKEEINTDLKHPQPAVLNDEIAEAIIHASTGITAIDKAIIQFFETGYLHNHVRMYIAFLACNVAKSHWKLPAQWMYYHLLDADWASNALSWQWVAGSNSNKKYVANQENINKYCHTQQHNTFLDVEYEKLDFKNVPEVLAKTISLDLKTTLPDSILPEIEEQKPTLLYNFYNLDPEWNKTLDANRILLLEPSLFEKYPVSSKSIDFCLALAKNIAGIQLYVGAFDDLKVAYPKTTFIFKEHPLNQYHGKEEPRDWMFSVKGYYPSFFGFWKKCKKEFR